ncbi:MAG: SDR family oxidoreductase [Nitrospirales bacterium]|nr:SDR family oxidoreductase [Nitrospirales bacterium]
MNRKIAVITGGARGLGGEITRALHRSGYRVVINYHHSHREAEALARELGTETLLVSADVSKAGDVARMAEAVALKWEKVDIVINNAGTTTDSLLIKQKEADWDRVIGTNLSGPFHTTKFFAPLMPPGGHIVNIASYSGLKGKPGQAAYSASKAALLGFTKTAAIELAGLGIRVNALLPGYMPTEMGAGAGPAMEQARADSLLHTLSDPQEVAELILYLVKTKNITGQVFTLDSRII